MLDKVGDMPVVQLESWIDAIVANQALMLRELAAIRKALKKEQDPGSVTLRDLGEQIEAASDAIIRRVIADKKDIGWQVTPGV
jgi:hypothetical protein